MVQGTDVNMLNELEGVTRVLQDVFKLRLAQQKREPVKINSRLSSRNANGNHLYLRGIIITVVLK